MKPKKILGIIVFIIGIYLISSKGPLSETCDRAMVRKDFSGYVSQENRGSYAAGIVLMIIGAGLFFFPPKSSGSSKKK